MARLKLLLDDAQHILMMQWAAGVEIKLQQSWTTLIPDMEGNMAGLDEDYAGQPSVPWYIQIGSKWPLQDFHIYPMYELAQEVHTLLGAGHRLGDLCIDKEMLVINHQSSQTLYPAVTRPFTGSMKCRRCEGVALAASMMPA